MPNLNLTVIAPVYNEEEIISTFHARVCETLNSLPDIDASILYIVDKCTDKTLEVLRKIVSEDVRVKVIALSARFGHQMSLVAGIDYSYNSDAIIMMDCDLQHPPELIPEMLARYREGFEVVYTVRSDTEDINPLRRLAGNLFYRLLANLSSVPIDANAADFRLISGRIAKILSLNFHERNMFLRGLFSWIGFKQTSIYYVAQKRIGGYSKYSLSKMLRLAIAGILSFSTKPLHLGIFVGIIFSLLSFLLMLTTLAEFFIDQTIPSGWTTIVVLLLLFSGIQLVMLGVVGAYIGAIYEEVQNRPRYIVEEEIFCGK